LLPVEATDDPLDPERNCERRPDEDVEQNNREQLEQLAHNYHSRHSENIINDKESDQ